MLSIRPLEDLIQIHGGNLSPQRLWENKSSFSLNLKKRQNKYESLPVVLLVKERWMSSFPKVKYYSDHSCQNLPYSLDVDLGIKGYTIWGYYKIFGELTL